MAIGVEFLETYAANLSSLVNTYDNMTGVNATGLAGDSYLWYFWDKVISEVSSIVVSPSSLLREGIKQTFYEDRYKQLVQ